MAKIKEIKDLATIPMNSNELSVLDLKHQIVKIQAVMKSVMIEGTHYGEIPGVSGTVLYKAGAEKLCMTFRLIPKYTTERKFHDNGHMTVFKKCELFHVSGFKAGEGEAVCSTLEKKYRYRNEDFPTGVEVPKAWWEKRDASNLPKILKNNGVTPKSPMQLKKEGLEIATGKIEGKFQVVYRKKVENPDIADVYNTVEKMAEKRAKVGATITALAVSDMFIQDADTFTGIEEPEEEEEEKELKTVSKRKKK